MSGAHLVSAISSIGVGIEPSPLEFAQELLGYPADIVVGKAANAELNRSVPFVSIPRVDRGSPA
jgi:hypothetical protein